MDRRIKASIVAKQRKDTPQEIAWRRAHAEVYAQILRERAERAPITAENFAEELAWQEARIKELMAARGFTS